MAPQVRDTEHKQPNDIRNTTKVKQATISLFPCKMIANIGRILTINTNSIRNTTKVKTATTSLCHGKMILNIRSILKVSKGAKIRNRYNQVPQLTQDTNGKVTNSQLDTTNESQEVSPFPEGDHEAHINRRAQRHSKHKTEQKHKRSTKEVPTWNGQ